MCWSGAGARHFPESGRIVNLYGPTETTLVKCFFVVPKDPPAGIQPVGRPLPDTQALILTEGLRLCGIGELGEIVLRTPFRSLGYLNAPGEQKDRFIPNPFRDRRRRHPLPDRRPRSLPPRRLTRDPRATGRSGQDSRRAGGAGRSCGGALRTSIGRSCAVVARTDDQGETALVAYVVSPHQGAGAAAELRSHLAGRIPAAMVPSAFVFLGGLPLTPNGKLNRAALPPPGLAAEERAERLELPRMPVEEIVATIWAAILGIERIGIHEDFFELGGHSLKATRVMSRVNQAFRLDLPVRALFENPTLASLSSVIERALLGEAEATFGRTRSPCLPAVTRDWPKDWTGAGPDSLRRARRFWKIGSGRRAALTAAGQSLPTPGFERAGVAFVCPAAVVGIGPAGSGVGFIQHSPGISDSGALDVEALGRALTTMEERHEVLRSVCRLVDGNPVQVVVGASGATAVGRGPEWLGRKGSGTWRCVVSPGRRRAGRLIWRRGRCCGRSCCAWPSRSTCCW